MHTHGVDFEWDENKRISNLRKHGIDFKDAVKLFFAPHIIMESNVRDGELRLGAVGKVNDVVVTVIFTLREGRIRIISARRARKNEKEAYYDSNK